MSAGEGIRAAARKQIRASRLDRDQEPRSQVKCLWAFSFARKEAKILETAEGIEVFETDIDLYLRLFCEENNIEDMREESQSVWNSCLYYIYKHVFKNDDILKDDSLIDNPNNNIKSTYNRYNTDMCMNVLNIYIYDMCMRYDKEVSIIGYTTLTGIPQSTMYEWGNGNRALSSAGKEIFEKLTRFREESLSNKLVTGAKNPVGVIAVLNRQFGWASPYTSGANKQEKALTVDELPRLNCTKTANNSEQDIVEDGS